MIGAAGYALVDAAFIAFSAWMLELILASLRRPRRFAWIAALGLSIALPAWRLPGALPGLSPFEISVTPRVVTLGRLAVPSSASTSNERAGSSSTPSSVDAVARSARAPASNASRESWTERLWTREFYRRLRFGFLTGWILASAALFANLLLAARRLARRARSWPRRTVDGVPVHVSEDLGPCVLGILRPRIVVPTWFEGASGGQRRAALAHEMEHLRTHDGRWLWAGVVLTAVFPWNLPLWWQLRRLRLAIGIDCDARVLRSGQNALEYGEALLDVAARMGPVPRGATGVFERRSHLERRLRVLASPGRHWWRYGAVPLYALCAIGALAAATLPAPPIDRALGVRNQTHRTALLSARQRAEEHRVRARLLTNGSPDALAAAAVYMMYRADTLESPATRARAQAGYLGPFVPPDANERYRWLAAAAAEAPHRADLVMMELRYCRAWNPNCDLAALRDRLRAMDPGNGAAWLGDLDLAYEKHDTAAIDAALTRIGESQRIDSDGTRIVPVLFHALHDLGGASAQSGYYWSSYAAGNGMDDLEAMIAIVHACSTHAGHALASGIEICRHVATALERGDSLLYVQIGYGLAIRLWPPDTSEGQIARRDKRRLDYLELASAKRPWPNRLYLVLGSARYRWQMDKQVLRAEAAYPREQDAWRAVLIRESVNPDPPRTWKDWRIHDAQSR